MNRIRKKPWFKTISLFLILFFLFQVDVMLSLSKKTDMEIQLELAQKEFENGQYEISKERLNRLINVLDPKISKEMKVLRRAKVLLKKIETPEKYKKIKKNVIYKPKRNEKENKKKKKFPLLLILGGTAVVALIIFLLTKDKSKKKREPNEFTLTVTKGTGVNGSPETGTYTYSEGESVNYSYNVQSGYSNLVVRLDGNTVSSSGIITMNSNHNLSVSGVQLGKLRLTSSPGGADIWINNILKTFVTPVTFKDIEPGRYDVTIRKAGCGVQKKSASVNEGQQTDVHFDLKNIKFGNQLLINAAAVQGFAEGYSNPDWYWFYIRDPGYYTIETYSAGRGKDIVDNYMHLYGPDTRSNEIAYDDDGGTDRYARISRHLEAPGNYYVKIRGYSSSYKGFYMIKIFPGQTSANTDEKNDLLQLVKNE